MRAILADAFRVPWVAVSTSRSINSFKWQDWAQTVGVTYRPRHVPISSRAEAITKGARFWGVEFKSPASYSEDPNQRSFDESLVMTSRTHSRRHCATWSSRFWRRPRRSLYGKPAERRRN